MRILLLAAASGLALSAPALAETSALTELVVTATRLPTAAEAVPGARIVTDKDIEARQATFAFDVLETIPGVSVFRNGAAGGTASIRLRGAETDKTLVVVDGVPVNDPSLPDGGYNLADLDLADVERIEVLAGPQGSIWGSDAIGGVVALTTRELNGWRAQAEAGSFGTAKVNAAWGMADESQAFGVSASGYRTDGISAAEGGTERDGFETWTVGVNGRKVLGPVEVDGRLRRTELTVDQDGYDALTFAFGDTPDWYESQAWSGYLRAAVEGFGLRQSLTFAGYDIDRASHSAFSSSYTARRKLWRWQAEGGGEPLAFVVGAEREDLDATVSTGNADQGATSGFAVVRWRPVETLTTTASVRHDDPDAYEGKTTARLSAAYEAGHGLTLSAAWGQGFKTPTISHTVCDFCFPAGPSTDLRPERAEGWDLRAAWTSPDERLSADVTGYRLAVRDQIAYVGRYVNLERTLTHGIEAEAQVQVNEAVSIRLAYAWTDAIDATTGAELYRSPEHSGSLSLRWETGRHFGEATIRAEGDQADLDPSTFSPARRDGFVVVDVADAWEIADGVELTARIENLTDADFQEVLGYSEYGRAAFVGIRLRR